MFLSKKHGLYYLFYTDDSGKRCSVSTGVGTKSKALDFLRSFNVEEEGRRRKMQHVSLRSFTETFLAHSGKVNTKDTADSNRTALDELARFVGEDRLLSKISVADCERFLAKKTADASLWTARKYYLALGAAFERAITWGYLLENPWRHVKKPKPPETLPAYFTREQLKVLIKSIPHRDLRELVIVAVLTGLRRGELLAMRWDWLDFPRRVLIVRNTNDFTTKSKRTRIVPLSNEALAILLSRHERRDVRHQTVFTMKGKVLTPDYITHQFKKAVRDADLPPELHLHSLRHSFASWLVQDGVSLYQVGKLLGHSTTQVTEMYAHLVPEDMHKVLGPLHLEN